MKSKFKSIVAFIVCFTLIFATLTLVPFAAEDSYVPDITYSGNESQLCTDKYNDVLFGDSWEKRYEIEVKNTKTKEVFTTVIPTTNGGKLSKVELKKLLSKEFKLIEFNEYVNNNYEPTAESVISTEEDDDLSACYVETVFDAACFSMSLAEFATNPSFWNGFAVVVDGLSIALPGVPAVGGLTVKAIKSSPKLFKALQFGIDAYKPLRKVIAGTGHHAHHIVMKTYAHLAGKTADDILCIALDSYTHQSIVTPALNREFLSNAPKTAIEWYNRTEKVYRDLYRTHGDYLYKYMADMVSERVLFLKN